MLGLILRFAAAAGLCLALGACQSATLIELNRDFVTLSQQQAEAKRLNDQGVLGSTDYGSAVEGYQAEFAKNGQKAEESAKRAETPQNKASFLNVAVRSYLKSGPQGDFKIPDLAEQGLEQCASEEMQGLNALPVTCGYFHVVVPQAVNNETVRDIAPLQRKAKRVRKSSEFLVADEGKRLEIGFGTFLDQIDALERARPNIDWDNVDPAFQEVFEGQKRIFFCNAWDTRRYFSDVVETGPGWNREEAKSRTGTRLEQTQQLAGVTQPSADCAGGTSPSA